MSRSFPAATLAAFSAPNVALLTFAKLDFASGILYVHNGLGTYTWGGQDWLGVGDFGQVSKLEEGADVSPYGITLTLSAIDATISNAALTEDYFLRDVDIYLGLLDADEALIEDPNKIWSGFMDVMTLTAGTQGDDVIQLTCESEMAKINRSRNLKYTHAEQQRVNSNDLFFEYLHEITGVKILWKDSNSGNLGVGNGGGGGGGGGGGRTRDPRHDPGDLP